MTVWLISDDDLTIEQSRAVEMGSEQHRLIIGGPGSGKTQVLLHRAKYLRDKYNVESGKFHIFVYTKVLMKYIKSSLDLLELPEKCVSTFDSWCWNFYSQQISKSSPKMFDGKPDFDAIRVAVKNKLKQNNVTPMFDFVLVDEGQDLDGISFDILNLITKHLTVFMDKKQQIYDRGSDEKEVLRKLSLHQQNISFLEVYRGCPYVARLAAEFINNDAERKAYLSQTKTEQSERQLPLLYKAKDVEDEKVRLRDVIKNRLLKGEKIAILLPQKRQAFGFAKYLSESDINVESPDNIDFTTDNPKLMPYHSVKGLTFDSVFMPRLVSDAFSHNNIERIQHLLFVGISRATQWVYLSTLEDDYLPILDNLNQLHKEGGLTVQTSSTTQNQKNIIIDNTGDDDDDDDDVLDVL